MAKRTPGMSKDKQVPPPPPDAVQMLRADHRRVRRLFDQWRAAVAEERSAIARRIFAELEMHTLLEEELFYPAVQAKLATLAGEDLPGTDGYEEETVEDEGEALAVNAGAVNGMELEVVEENDDDTDMEIVSAAYDSHQSLKELIQQLRAIDPSSGDFTEVLTELEETVLEHVGEEEETLLPMAAAQLDVVALGLAMQRRRDDLTSQSSLAA